MRRTDVDNDVRVTATDGEDTATALTVYRVSHECSEYYTYRW
jgi:hypothetical protein